ncbi:MAG: arylsulfatase [Phycisphaerales bacterium]|jgi:arylsulfatase A-like enzyme|nr:arylsulfatase [Phycisphaerales bacterium]
MRYASGFAVFIVLLMSTATCVAADATPSARPNILFIIADDMGYADVGFNGGKEIKTPNIDSIAAAGARLEQFYAQPVCSPTRAALMTGRYPMRYGFQTGVVRPHADYGVPLDERFLPAALKEAGYATAICGKWHLGHVTPDYLPTHRGFDRQYGHYNGAIDYFSHIRDGGLDWHRDDKALREEGYSTALLAAEATKIITSHDGKKPFFLYVPFNAVHAPHQVPDRYKEPYAALSEPRRTYAGMLAAMDEGVGKILAALDEKKLRDDTLIIFTSDNGGPGPGRVTDNGPLRAGKGTVYEGGVRVAACVAWQGKIPAGSNVKQPVHMVDFYPTLLNLAGVSLEQKLPLDGKDAWATIAKGAASPHEEILLNASPFNGAIRMGDWKLVLNGGQRDNEDAPEAPAAPTENAPRRKQRKQAAAAGDEVELFNLAEDVSEKHNLAEKNPEKVKELRARYDAFAKQAVPPKSKPKPPDFKSPAVWGEAK